MTHWCFHCEWLKHSFPSVLQLEECKAENEATCESHREKIQQLWSRLQVPQEEREALNEHMVSSRRRNLEAVRGRPSSHRDTLLMQPGIDGCKDGEGAAFGGETFAPVQSLTHRWAACATSAAAPSSPAPKHSRIYRQQQKKKRRTRRLNVLCFLPSVTNGGPASGGAQTAEHPERDRRHPLGDRRPVGQVFL